MENLFPEKNRAALLRLYFASILTGAVFTAVAIIPAVADFSAFSFQSTPTAGSSVADEAASSLKTFALYG